MLCGVTSQGNRLEEVTNKAASDALLPERTDSTYTAALNQLMLRKRVCRSCFTVLVLNLYVTSYHGDELPNTGSLINLTLLLGNANTKLPSSVIRHLAAGSVF